MKQKQISKWDERFLRLADFKATWSKDPSTKVGCVITRGNRDIAHGYNGFPPRIEDTFERLNNYELRQMLMIHAELNAFIAAKQDLTGCTLYSTRPPCIRCAVIIIAVGITRVVSYEHTPEKKKKHKAEYKLVKKLYKEAGIQYETYPF